MKEGGIQALKRQVNEDNVHGNRTDQEITDTVIELSVNRIVGTGTQKEKYETRLSVMLDPQAH